MKTRKIITLILAVALTASLVSGCKSRDASDASSSSTSSSVSSSTSSSSSSSSSTSGETVESVLPGMAETVRELKAENPDTVGWFQLSQLGIGDVVVMNKESNEYYRRRNFKKEEAFNGVLFADKRSTFGDGSVEQLGMNTCVYGHAMADIRGEKNYNVFFGPLHDFRDPAIAKTLPYIFFTTEKQDYAFEVFAVFIANTDNHELPYNRNDVTPEVFQKMIKEQVLPRSLYNYNVEIKPDDKFLTLSTCIYNLPNGTKSNWGDTYIRYAIMGRLVDPKSPLKEEADFTINEKPIIDADGPVASKK